MNTYTARYRMLARQRAYQRDILTSGLSALLAPYSIRPPAVPRQRTKTAESLPSVGVSG